MAAVQADNEIQSLLSQLEGQEIAVLQVLGINSLKSTDAMPEMLAGDVVESTTVDQRCLTVITTAHKVLFDLERTGKLNWLREAAPYVMSAGSPRPTVRVVLASGQGLDLTEPARTKRIMVTISTRP